MSNQFRAWLICLIAACFFSYELVQLHMLNALSPHIMSELKLNATQLATLSSTYLLADVLFLIPAGLIIDRFSVRKVILAALGFCILGTIGFAFSQTFFHACVSHFFSGIGNAFCFLSCMILANGWFKEKSTFVMSFMITIGLLGGVIAQVPFSLLAEAFNWRNALIIDAAIGVFIWGLNYLFVFDALEEEKKLNKKAIQFGELFSQLKSACQIKETWICGFYTGLMNLPLMIISAMVGNLFLTQVHGLSQTKASFAISMISLGTIIGSSFCGWLSEKLNSKKKIMMIGALSSGFVFLILLFIRQPRYEFITAIFFLIGFLSASQVLGYPMITDAAPEQAKGTAMGVSAVIIMGLAFILQPITGVLLDWNKTSLQTGYSAVDFQRAFILFPIAFVLSLLLASSVNEKKVQLASSQANL
jgi:MFS family permease